jgi:hypothetical protein
MRIGNHSLREHIRLLMPLFGFMMAVWALRIVLDAAGAPQAVVYACSVTVAGAVAVVMAVLLVHARHFGSYPSVVAAAFLLALWQQVLISAAIAFALLTRTQNVYTRPQFHPGMPPLQHIQAQLTWGVGFSTLLGSAMGCILLWLLRRLVPLAEWNSK